MLRDQVREEERVTIAFGHMEAFGVLNKSRLNVGAGTEVQLE